MFSQAAGDAPHERQLESRRPRPQAIHDTLTALYNPPQRIIIEFRNHTSGKGKSIEAFYCSQDPFDEERSVANKVASNVHTNGLNIFNGLQSPNEGSHVVRRRFASSCEIIFPAPASSMPRSTLARKNKRSIASLMVASDGSFSAASKTLPFVVVIAILRLSGASSLKALWMLQFYVGHPGHSSNLRQSNE